MELVEIASMKFTNKTAHVEKTPHNFVLRFKRNTCDLSKILIQGEACKSIAWDLKVRSGWATLAGNLSRPNFEINDSKKFEVIYITVFITE